MDKIYQYQARILRRAKKLGLLTPEKAIKWLELVDAWLTRVKALPEGVKKDWMGRRDSPIPVFCLNCGWVGPTKGMVHTYRACGHDDVEPVDKCPMCETEDDNGMWPASPPYDIMKEEMV